MLFAVLMQETIRIVSMTKRSWILTTDCLIPIRLINNMSVRQIQSLEFYIFCSWLEVCESCHLMLLGDWNRDYGQDMWPDCCGGGGAYRILVGEVCWKASTCKTNKEMGE
jgi:hypothetical protein